MLLGSKSCKLSLASRTLQLLYEILLFSFSARELERKLDQIKADKPLPLLNLAGSILAAFSFALFYQGSIPDAVTASLVAILIWSFQRYLRPVCMNEVTFQFAASFLSGCVICGAVLLFQGFIWTKL